ncbi:MAG: rhodanese-like domain-containing protein [Spirosomataceae bacterium]
MLQVIKNLLGLGPKADYAALLQQGAVIVDVRTKGEYAGGHVKGSINIPLDVLGSNLAKFKDKNTPIITCCASGMRSASAASLLKSKGYTQVYNGGGWMSLQRNL